MALVLITACSRSQAAPETAATPRDSALAPGPTAQPGPTATVPERRRSYPDRYAITQEELQQEARGIANLYDYVVSRHNDWMRASGSGRMPSAMRSITVYLDGIRFGGSPESLRQIPIAGVYLARRLSPSEAEAKYGLDNNAGTIEIFTSRDRVR